MSINREKLNQIFRQEYEKLNPQQRKAVDQIEGPVMVIAGPGTGKTQILASRIGKILLDTDTLPQNILCLTYTDAGVIAMRKRLLKFIGPDAYKVNIFTFHAFCNEVIQDNLNLFEKTALDPISDLERVALMRELIDSFPKNHLLKKYRGDVYSEINNLIALYSIMKREGWSAELMTQRIDEYISSMPEREEFFYKTSRAGKWTKGDRKPDYQETIDKLEKTRAAVNEFPRFQELMRKRNRYDFDDMITWVLNAFEENKTLLARYQEQFLYILVDEYQDTSGTQNRLIELLISYWDRPNVFVVGDDDQSIYRFQGANVENMMMFADSYKDVLLTVVLTDNYRSIQPILNVSRTIIDQNNDRLVKRLENLSKDLVASRAEILHLDHLPVIKEYQSQRDEMIGITLEIDKLITEGAPPGKIAVLYKENRYGEQLAKYFKLLDIPVYSKRNLNILELPLAQKLILLMRYLAAEHDTPFGGDEMLFEILHFDWFDIPPLEIAKLSIEVADRQFGENRTSIRRLMNEKALLPPKDLFTPTIHENLKRASHLFEKLIAVVPNVTLQSLFEKIVREAGVLNHIMQSNDKHWHLQVVTGLFDFIKEETRRNPFMNLKDIVGLIELMNKEEIPLPLVQISGNEKGVNLLTTHGSKGLEFEWVFIAGCNADYWEKKRKNNRGFTLPDNLFSSQPTGDNGEELRRLFYVALTRAEKRLTLSYSRFKNDGKEWEPSMFIEEIKDQHGIDPIPCEISIIEASRFATLEFNEKDAPEIDKLEEEFVSRMLDKFVMNVTALSNYLKCPLEFYFRNLIRIPSPKNEATEFGSSAHFALEQLFRKMKERKEFPGKAEFIIDFEWYMHRHRESFTKEQFERRLEYGHEILNNYYDKYIHSFNTIVAIEMNIRNVVLNNIPLKGKLDKLEFDGKKVNVVDYKTGDPDKAKKKLQRPDPKEPLGGDYWRQAVFYKILVDNYENKGWRVISTQFDFIEPDKKKEFKRATVDITPEDIAEVSKQITEVWQKIQQRDFYTGCGKEDCHWCNFVKTNNLTVAPHEIEEEQQEE